jgi:hypothetical protein
VDPLEIDACLDRVEALDPAINAAQRLLRRLQDARLEAMHDGPGGECEEIGEAPRCILLRRGGGYACRC